MWKLFGAFLFAATTVTTSSGTILDKLSAGSTFPTHAITSTSSNLVNKSQGVPEFPQSNVIPSLLDLKNVVMATSSPSEILPTVHSVANVSMETSSSSSLNLVLFGNRAVETDARLSPTEVVVIATGVTLLSLATVVISIAMTILIRRRTRHKAYLRVRHASQAELCVHYVQNTAASVAARDAAMEQLFQSLASIDPDIRTPDCQDERCLTPTESVASTGFVAAKTKPHSRSMPSLKNLNAHEEALNCTFTPCGGGVFGESPRKLGARSRSLTERTALGVDPTGTKSSSAARSHSERVLKNRLVLPPGAGKRFEKKGRNKPSRRSNPSFSRLVKFGVFGGQSTKRKPAAEEEVEKDNVIVPEVEKDNVIVPCAVESQCGARNVDVAAAASDRKRSSSSLLDFKVPSMSLMLHDIGPMLTAFQNANEPTTDPLPKHSGSPSDNTQDIDKLMDNQLSEQTEEEEDENRQHNNRRCNSHATLQPETQNSKINRHSDIAICTDDKLEVRGTNKQKAPSFEEVHSRYLHGSNNQITKAFAFSSVGHLGSSCKDRAVGDHN